MRKRKNLAARMEQAGDYLISPVLQPQLPLSAASRCLLELGCGMGRFACETAAVNPEAFVIGVERVADAIIIGMERAKQENLSNVRFLLGDAEELPRFFAPGSIDELYIHFCDPWPHRKQASRRLVARNFLQIYRPLLNGTLYFRTDNAPLFAFAQKELLTEGWTITQSNADSPPAAGMTDYEIKFRAKNIPICSLSATPFS
ncbi:MAG: tRNA (guanosine(46)-N7)-methyltransferase TrmB [Oscillospiraceae bacterium]|nr:tRNA (guanosine(46)-N7)-methyltransferase TrmB [Oscillospiraceae bacterium]